MQVINDKPCKTVKITAMNGNIIKVYNGDLLR